MSNNEVNDELEKVRELFEYEMTRIKLNLQNKSKDAFDNTTLYDQSNIDLEKMNIEIPNLEGSVDLDLAKVTPEIESGIPAFVEQASNFKTEESEINSVKIETPNKGFDEIKMCVVDVKSLIDSNQPADITQINAKNLSEYTLDKLDAKALINDQKNEGLYHLEPLSVEQMQISKEDVKLPNVNIPLCNNSFADVKSKEKINVSEELKNVATISLIKPVDCEFDFSNQEVILPLNDFVKMPISEKLNLDELKKIDIELLKKDAKSLIKSNEVSVLKDLSMEIPHFDFERSIKPSVIDYEAMKELEEFAKNMRLPEIPKELKI